MITRLVMLWLHHQYKKHGDLIFYIKGTGKDYPKYMLYTEDVSVHSRMTEFYYQTK